MNYCREIYEYQKCRRKLVSGNEISNHVEDRKFGRSVSSTEINGYHILILQFSHTS